MPDIFIPNPVAALPPARAMFRPPPPAQTAGILAQALPQIGQQIGQGIQGLAAAKQQKADLEATAAFLDERGNPAAANLLRSQAANINPLFGPSLGGGGGGAGGGGLGGSLVRDILRNDMEKELIQARGQQQIAAQEASFRKAVALESIRNDNYNSRLAQQNTNYANRLAQNFIQDVAKAGLVNADIINQASQMVAAGDPQSASNFLLSNIPDAAARQEMKMKFEQDEARMKAELNAQATLAETLRRIPIANAAGMIPSQITESGALTFRTPTVSEEDELNVSIQSGPDGQTKRISGTPDQIKEYLDAQEYESGKSGNLDISPEALEAYKEKLRRNATQ